MPDRLRDLVRRPWRDVVLPPDAVGIPTMLSKTERKLLYSLARDHAGGEAAIVDAGCFLGGSTAALLAGVRDRVQSWVGPPVESYDLFRIEAFTIPKFFATDRGARVGDSFRPRFDAHVARFDLPHVVHEGDITELGDVPLVHDVRKVESSDVSVEAGAKRVADAGAAISREELRDRERLDPEEVVALDRRADPRLHAVAHAGEESGSRAAEETACVNDRRLPARVVTSERIEQLALRLREHRGNPDGVRRQDDVPPRTANEVAEPVARHRPPKLPQTRST